MCLFFFNDTATTEIYTLSLHDALPIFSQSAIRLRVRPFEVPTDLGITQAHGLREQRPGLVALEPAQRLRRASHTLGARSEEHTSELQSRQYLVCRLLLEKKKLHAHLTH